MHLVQVQTQSHLNQVKFIPQISLMFKVNLNNVTSKRVFTGYNPLMGDNARRYRPPKRSCCGKGGCG